MGFFGQEYVISEKMFANRCLELRFRNSIGVQEGKKRWTGKWGTLTRADSSEETTKTLS